MNGEDARDFWQAQAAQVKKVTLEAMKAWELVDSHFDIKVVPLFCCGYSYSGTGTTGRREIPMEPFLEIQIQSQIYRSIAFESDFWVCRPSLGSGRSVEVAIASLSDRNTGILTVTGM